MGLLRRIDLLSVCFVCIFLVPLAEWLDYRGFASALDSNSFSLLLGQLFVLARGVGKVDTNPLVEFGCALAIFGCVCFSWESRSFLLLVPSLWLVAAIPPFLLRQLDLYRLGRRGVVAAQYSLRDVAVLLTSVICSALCLFSFRAYLDINDAWFWQFLPWYFGVCFATSAALLLPALLQRLIRSTGYRLMYGLAAFLVLIVAMCWLVVATKLLERIDLEYPPPGAYELTQLHRVASVESAGHFLLSFFLGTQLRHLSSSPQRDSGLDQKRWSLDRLVGGLGFLAFVVTTVPVGWDAQQLASDRNKFDREWDRIHCKAEEYGGYVAGPFCGNCIHPPVCRVRLAQANDEVVAEILGDIAQLDKRWVELWQIDLEDCNTTDKVLESIGDWSSVSSINLSATNVIGKEFRKLNGLRLGELELRSLDLTQADWKSIAPVSLHTLDICNSHVSPSFKAFRSQCDLSDFLYENARVIPKPLPWR